MLDYLWLWAGFTLVFVGFSLKLQWEVNRASRLLKDGDLELLVSEMDRLSGKVKNRQASLLIQLNKSAGLVYLGRWDEAVAILENLSVDDLKAEAFKTLYLNNLLYSYLLLGKFSEARRLFSENEPRIVPEGALTELNLAVFSTLATYRYFFDSPESSRRLFERLLEHEMDDRPKACILYFLGRLDIHEGNSEHGWARLEQSRSFAVGIFIEQEFQALKAGHPRIGAPGDGALA